MNEQTSTPVIAYGRVARVLHWGVAFCVVLAVALGLLAADVDEGDATERVLALHKSVGMTILVLMCVRMAWRATHRPPPLPAEIPPGQRIAAGLTHALLYATLVVMPVAGYVAVAARGRETRFFGLFDVPNLAPLSRVLSQNATTLHVYGQYVLYALLAAHIGAALYHRFVRKDDILRRMWPRRASK